jgi:hypothetical protein
MASHRPPKATCGSPYVAPRRDPIWAMRARTFEKFTTKIRWVIRDCSEEGFPP